MQLRGNWIHAERGVDNLSALAGIGYQLDAAPSVKVQNPPEKPVSNEVTVFLGQAMANSFSSEPSIAADVEYRRRLAPFLEWTVSSIYEGDNGIQNRSGLATQLWVVHSFLDERLTLGFGGGPYFVVDTYHPGNDETVVANEGVGAHDPGFAERRPRRAAGSGRAADPQRPRPSPPPRRQFAERGVDLQQ
jgi:hypothetical protein